MAEGSRRLGGGVGPWALEGQRRRGDRDAEDAAEAIPADAEEQEVRHAIFQIRRRVVSESQVQGGAQPDAQSYYSSGRLASWDLPHSWPVARALRWALAVSQSVARLPGRDGFADACGLSRGTPSSVAFFFPVSAAWGD